MRERSYVSVVCDLLCVCVIVLQEWFTVFDQYRRTNCVVSDLIMGNDYVFRVFAINLVGLSPEPCNTKDSAYIQKTGECDEKRGGKETPELEVNGSTLPASTGLLYKPASFKEHNFSQAPKFTHPLVSRSVIAGYNATLSCSVRGIPKVRGVTANVNFNRLKL